MSYHLVVTRPFGAHKIGSIITDPAEVKTISDGPYQRSVNRVYEGTTHVGMPQTVDAVDSASEPALELTAIPEPTSADKPRSRA